jgi:hypothetical protein
MGRVKILSSQPSSASIDISAGLVKYTIPIGTAELGNFIKAEKKDGEIIVYFQRIIKEEPAVDPQDKSFIVSF